MYWKYCIFRFATSKYKEPSGHNISNMFMHLTNYSVNKHSRMYIIDDEIGSKRFVHIGSVELVTKHQLIANYSLQKNIYIEQMVKNERCRCGRIMGQNRRNYN